MANPRVAIAGCSSYDRAKVAAAVGRLVGQTGGLSTVRAGDRVLVKPNFIAPFGPQYPVQTHPAVVLEVVRLLRDMGARPFVGDSPAWANVFACADKLGLTRPLGQMGVKLVQLDEPALVRIDGSKVAISRHALEADSIVNLPKFKSHQQLVATFAVKNMFGCVSGKRKALWHFRRGAQEQRFCRLLIGIYKHLAPAVTIIDAVEAMEGPGPIRGTVKKLGCLVGGAEPIAIESVCAQLVGLDPAALPIVRTAAAMGIGIEDYQLAGDDIGGFICPDFVHARQIPIKFSLLRVCKSMARQAILKLAR